MSQQPLSYARIRNWLSMIKSPLLAVEPIGKSVQGKDILCAVISKDPKKYGIPYCAQQYEKLKGGKHSADERKIPIVLSAAIHGHETVGIHAIMDFIEFMISKENEHLLDHFIFICIICGNPDGVEDETRFNHNGFDLNRDFIFQTQPETQAIVELIKTCNPIALFDLHGYVSMDKKKIGLIEPCTPPHNPNYEYDLYRKWAMPLAKAMEKTILKMKGAFSSIYYKNMQGVCIPYRDLRDGWDDYSPFSTAMYAMLHGAIGLTIEAPARGRDGIQWMVNALLGACRFLQIRKQEILDDYSTFLQRGIQQKHPNYEGDFPHAYLFPAPEHDCSAANQLVGHLLKNGIEVHLTTKNESVDRRPIPKGSYYIPMNQAKAILANAFLSKGEKDFPMKMIDLCTWCLPVFWGVECIALHSPINIQTIEVNKASPIPGHPEKGPYKLEALSVGSLRLIQNLLKRGIDVYQSPTGNILIDDKGDKEVGRLIGAAKVSSSSADRQAIRLANRWSAKRIGIIRDGGLFYKQSHAGLKLTLQKLGYSIKEFHPRDLTDMTALSRIDVLIYNGFEHLFLTKDRVKEPYKQYVIANKDEYEACRETINQFLARGGRVIAIGAGPSKAIKQMLKLKRMEVNVSGWNDNAIVQVNYNPHSITAGYSLTDFGFVYRPVWYSKTTDMEVLASYSAASGSLIAGYWPDYEQAKGLPVIVKDKNLNLIFIGLEICHRAQPEFMYRLLVNAIHS